MAAAGSARNIIRPAGAASAQAVVIAIEPAVPFLADAGFYARYAKRAFNVVFGALLLITLAPLFGAVALAVRLTSGGHQALLADIVTVRPGITGPFQVYGRRRLTPTTRIQLEAAYRDGMTLLGDLGYIVRTAKPLVTLDGNLA